MAIDVKSEQDSKFSTSFDSISATDITDFEADLQSAKDNLQKITDYLNVLILAYESASTIPTEKFSQAISVIQAELVSALTFYRLSSRNLAIRSRIAQETHQSATNYASAELAKLERLYAELEIAKGKVDKLVPPDYSVFGDLKMISREELEESVPDLYREGNLTEAEKEHIVRLAQLQHESDRRKGVIKEIEELEREKRLLNEQIKRRHESMDAVNLEVERCQGVIREHLAPKLNVDLDDLKRNLDGLQTHLLETVAAARSGAVTIKDEDMTEVAADEPPLSPEGPMLQIAEESEMAREEGEASDEGEEMPSS